MPSIGAKKAAVCPSGEQITDGDFEACDLAAWVTTKTGGAWGCVAEGAVHLAGQVWPHSGTYMARFDNIGGSEQVTGTIEQDFAAPIPVSCFEPDSVFTVWTNHLGDGCPPETPTVWQIEVLYTDETSTVIDISGDPSFVWTEHDLKAVLEVGKTVKGIKFIATLGPNREVFIDACTCFIKNPVTIQVDLEGIEDNDDAVVIAGAEYKNGEVAALASGDYNLTWKRYTPGVVFNYWEASGDISIEDVNAETTILTVFGIGMLTLYVKYE
jgi:hypothetical protein